ncbi:MAG: hypothetical protein J6X79_08080, partial [Bacteroidales bacterium]|nr:hypothetical protein [Bacteroidales bacterium]
RSAAPRTARPKTTTPRQKARICFSYSYTYFGHKNTFVSSLQKYEKDFTFPKKVCLQRLEGFDKGLADPGSFLVLWNFEEEKNKATNQINFSLEVFFGQWTIFCIFAVRCRLEPSKDIET